MVEVSTCKQCGSEVSADSPGGLCPHCLFAAASKLASPTQSRQPSSFVPPTPQELAPHFPQYELLSLLGAGGMGAVYCARQKSLDRVVALKVIHPDAAADADFAERFLREARALAKLNHPNIVGVFDFGEAGTYPGRDGDTTLYYFVMEYVDGANLRELMEDGELTPAEAVVLIPQICEALQYAHDEHVVHRDIKPENILVDSRGRAKIADFGLAKLLGRTVSADFTLTGTHQIMGTPRYMAPEQIEGTSAVDHRADIYSLGVVFYEMLTGELPIGSFEPPSRKAAVDVRLDEVVLRTLAKEPARRYQHVSEVKTDIETISRVEAKPVPQTPPTRRESPHHSGDLSWSVAQQLHGCKVALFVAALGGLLFWCSLVGFMIVHSFRGAIELSGGATIQSHLATWVVVAALIALLVGGLHVFTSWCFLRGGGRTAGVVSAAIGLLPYSPAWIVGLPAGLWALGLLARSDVAQAAAKSGPQTPAERVRLPGAAMIAAGSAGALPAAVAFIALVVSTGGVSPAAILCLLAVGLSAGTVLAGVYMRALEQYELVISFCFICMLIPFNPLALPVAVWSLVLLLKPEIKRAFSDVPELDEQLDAVNPRTDWTPLFTGAAMIVPLTCLAAFGLWFSSSSWGLLVLALPWFAIGHTGTTSDGGPQEKAVGWLAALTFLLSLALIAFGIWIERSAWPLIGIAIGFGGIIAGGMVASAAEPSTESDTSDGAAKAPVPDSSGGEEAAEDSEEPAEKIKTPAWFLGLLGGLRCWELVANSSWREALDQFDVGRIGTPSEMIVAFSGPILVFTALGMYHARNYWLVVAGCTTCFVTGHVGAALIGIWSLFVLFDPKVRSHFEAQLELFDAK